MLSWWSEMLSDGAKPQQDWQYLDLVIWIGLVRFWHWSASKQSPHTHLENPGDVVIFFGGQGKELLDSIITSINYFSHEGSSYPHMKGCLLLLKRSPVKGVPSYWLMVPWCPGGPFPYRSWCFLDLPAAPLTSVDTNLHQPEATVKFSFWEKTAARPMLYPGSSRMLIGQ